MMKPAQRDKLTARKPLQAVLGMGAVVALLVACGSSNSDLFPIPVIPAAKSPLVAPDLTVSCPITNSWIESLVIKGRAPAYNGAQFGTVGTYEYILAEASAKVNSNDPCAATIVDLKNSADASGMVNYKFDVVILTPSDSAKASGSMLYVVNNRTNTSALDNLNDSTANDLFNNVAPVIPTTATGTVTTGVGAGSAYLMKKGMTVVLSGWQGDRPSSLSGATAAISSTKTWYPPGMTLPVAKDAAGAKITGGVQDEFIADNATSSLLGTYYPRVTTSPASLWIRKSPTDAYIVVDPSMWTYTAGTGVAEGGNTTATGFGYVTIDRTKVKADAKYAAALDNGSDNGSIYHFNYTASDAKAMGLGFLGVRDLISFLRYETQDKAGNANPVAGRIKTSLATGNSQSGRYLRDFLWMGFNADRQVRKVFDGMLPLVGGSRKTYTNYRWSKPGDYSRQHETHYTPGDQFPFAYSTITDPLSGKTDGLMKKCTELNTCPKVYQYDSPIEFGGARASLVSTDGAGKDLEIPANVRLFYSAGTSHGPQQLANNAKSQPDYSVQRAGSAVASMPGALNASSALYRALMSSLEDWAKGTGTPLASNWPKVSDGTMAVPTSNPQSLTAPNLTALGLGFNGVYNTLTLNDESVIPSVPTSKMYVVHLPTSDTQGNSKSGVKMPDSAVPLATFVGYSIRNAGYVQGDQNGLSSSQLGFALNTASKNASDPRKSAQELYTNPAGYLAKWNASVDTLVADKLMLPDDAVLYKNRGLMQSVQPNFAKLGQ